MTRRAQSARRLAWAAAVGAAAAAVALPSAAADPPTHPHDYLAGSNALTVSSTLDGRTLLPQRVHWTVILGALHVKEVDFFIDGRLAWVEHAAPYTFGGDGNWLDTSLLTPGLHTFTTKAVITAGGTAVDSVTARVKA